LTVVRRAAVLTVLVCLLSPGEGRGQQERNGLPGGVLALWGAVAGTGLAVVYISPPGEGWLVSDEVALPFGVVLGLGTALLANAAASDIDSSAGRRPRFRVTAGTGGKLDLDYSVGYRHPIGPRTELDAAILIMNDTWEQFETQTRCGILGCITGTYLTGYSYQQSVTALVRGIHHFSATSSWNPTVAVGGGPTVVHFESKSGESRHTGLLLDAGAGIERGHRYRWTATTGVRVTPIGSSDEATVDDFTWYVRLGVALGG